MNIYDSTGLQDIVIDAGTSLPTDGTTGEEISLQGVTDKVKVIMKFIPKQRKCIASHIKNEGLFWLVTDVLGIDVPETPWDPISITLDHINKKIAELQEDMQVLLDVDFKAAFQWLELAASDLKNEDFESAFGYLEKVEHDSVRAYSQVKTFQNKVFCKNMTIFSKYMIKCYNKKTKSFDHLSSLLQNKQKALADSVLMDVDLILEEFEKIEDDPNWWQRMVNNAKSKSDEQYVLDGLLKVALPIIWYHNDLFQVKDYRDKDMLKYIPDGKEDAAEILLEGRWPIRVWKACGWLHFEFQNKNAVDEGIRNTKFHRIAINGDCKYYSNSWFCSVV